MGEGLLVTATIRLMLTTGYSLSALFTMQTLASVVNESRREKVLITQAYKAARVDAEKKDSEDEIEEEEDDGEGGLNKVMRKNSLWKFWQTKVRDNKAPPPTEDQVKNVKTRTFYTAMAVFKLKHNF